MNGTLMTLVEQMNTDNSNTASFLISADQFHPRHLRSNPLIA